VLLVADGYAYGGKRFDVRERAAEVLAGLPSVEHCVLVPHLEPQPALPPRMQAWPEVLAAHAGAKLTFVRLPFDHPLYILFSSGTTGAPKCIVHGAGGTLLQHLKEQRLHVDLRPGERFFYFTTCGWMMWNWLVSGLASQATLCLYDGSPMHPDALALFAWAAREKVSVFGASAKFLDGVAKSGARPGRDCDLSGVRALLSTGSRWRRRVRLRLPARGAPRTARLDLPAARTSCRASCSAARCCRSGAARSRPGLGMRSRSSTTRGIRCAGRRASWSARRRSRRCP